MSLHRHALTLCAIVVASSAARFIRPTLRAQSRATAPCAASADFQRLNFWIGDWEVLDSTGAHYATQRVRAVIDGCALTVEWTGRVGDKGLGMSAYDPQSHSWKQMYVSNQVPYAASVRYRVSDPTYKGPGVRFIPASAPGEDNRSQTRVTIMPLSGDRAMQQFEDSADGGRTWHVEFKAEHRRRPTEKTSDPLLP